MTATVLMVPVVLMAMLLVVQYGLAYHARQVIAGAAQDGAVAAARRDATVADGIALTDQLVESAAGNLLVSHSTAGTSTGDTVTVSVTGEVGSLLPFFGTITVRAASSATVEAFTPQGVP